jgi:hypothetical protein
MKAQDGTLLKAFDAGEGVDSVENLIRVVPLQHGV